MQRRIATGVKWVLLSTILAGFAIVAEEPEALSTASAMARVTKKVAPEYPAAARQLNVTGQQELALVVNGQGDVDEVKVVRGNAMFTQSSLSAVKQWKFTPLVKDGAPARFTATILINYSK